MAHSEKNYVLQSREAYTRKKYTVKRTKIVNSPVGNFKKGTVSGDTSDNQSSNKKKANGLFKGTLDESSKKEASAKEQKKSSYIRENIRNDASAPDTEQPYNAYSEQYDNVGEMASSDNDEQWESTLKSEEKPVHCGAKADSTVSNQKDVSAKAEQMKKAAYIKERLQKNIAASQKAVYYEQNEEISDKQNSKPTKGKDNTPSYVKEKMDGNTVVDSRYLGNSESISENKHTISLGNPDVKKAYKTKIMSDKLTERRMYAADMRSQAQTNAALIAAEKAKTAALKKAESESESKDSFSQLEKAAEYMTAVGSGDVAKVMLAKPAEDYLKSHLSSGTNAFLDKAGTAVSAVKNSDSVGDAAANVGRTLITDAVKKSVSNALNKPLRQKSVEERLEKKFHYIDRKTDKEMSRIQSEKREAMNGNISKGLEKKLDKIDRKQEQYKEKLAKQQKELQRRQQKNIYIRHNRNNTAFKGSTAQLTRKKLLSAKKSGILLGGIGGSVFVGMMAIIIILILICSLFSWISPYSYSLAGRDEKNVTYAETNAEIIDGYVLLVKNYFDVKQAYFYLDYSDWYGGTYSYGDASIDKAEYIEEYIADIVKTIEDSYEEKFKEAGDNQKLLESLSKAMEEEISEAMKTAHQKAEESLKELLATLNDELSAATKRRHYEIHRSGGKNGINDSEEFTGPIVGTNQFDDVEIHSDLSAEEMVALIAIYKTMKNTGEKPPVSDEEEESENIYCISPKDIMEFFKETEYIKVEQEFTHDNLCEGQNCIRQLVGDIKSGYYWEYYCSGDHDNMTGEMTVKTKDELIEKMVELLNGIDGISTTEEECIKIFDAYIDMIDKELGDERRYFGAADNTGALALYNTLICSEDGEIPNNFWKNDSDDSDESEGDENA